MSLADTLQEDLKAAMKSGDTVARGTLRMALAALKNRRIEVGEDLAEGEELAVVEAMKMENSLRAVQDGVVKTVSAEVGDSLVVDQPIIEFE